MNRGFSVTRDPLLPKLAWYATWLPSASACEVEVGPQVEVDRDGSPRWVVAGVWSGDFAAGDFHTSELLAGSGLRLEDDGLHLVSSNTGTDRCVYVKHGDRWHLSNSLVVLLGRLGARFAPDEDHRAWGESVCEGLFHYRRDIPIKHALLPNVSQVVFESLKFGTDGSLSFFFRDKPRRFSGYQDYVSQVDEVVKALWANATDAGRQLSLRAATTASRGYDSAAVTALVTRVIPSPDTWSAPTSNTRIPGVLRKWMDADVLNDDGGPIAERLGARPRHLDATLSSLPADLEAWCWASAQLSPELIFHSMLADADRQPGPTLLFVGHHGDRLWSRHAAEVPLAGRLARGAPSGASLIEARLAHGVVECSLPYVFARSAAEVHKVSTSREMQPWTLGTEYDRPIPRRLLEERGVPRPWFGFGKKAVSQDFESPQGDALRKVFFNKGGWTPAAERLYRGVNLGVYFARRSADFVRERGKRAGMEASMPHDGKRTLARIADLQRTTFLTCTDLLASRYAR